MKEVFKHTEANCKICGTPTNGKRKIGNDYYCADDFERESIQEKLTTLRNREHLKEHRKIFNG